MIQLGKTLSCYKFSDGGRIIGVRLMNSYNKTNPSVETIKIHISVSGATLELACLSAVNKSILLLFW